MPCTYDDSAERALQARENDKIKASLCAIMTALESNMDRNGISNLENMFRSHINFKEAGVNQKWLRKWWEAHKKADAERRKQEQDEREESEAKNKALAKLTKKERSLLGVYHYDPKR